MKKFLLKKVFVQVLLISFLGIFPVFSETEEDLILESPEADDFSLFDEDFDSLFEEASDTEAVTSTAENAPSVTQNLTFPLRFSGHLDSDFGGGYVYQKNSDDDFTGYFTFNSYLYMNARPTPDTAVKGTIGISFPNYDLGLSEFYFDYIIKSKVYFTAGKKATTWGYPRLLTVSSNATKDEKEDFEKVSSVNTNILSDSQSGTSFMVRFPLFTGTVSGIALYKGGDTQPSLSEMIFAGSVEMVFFKTSINLFGRGGKNEKDLSGNYAGPLIGLEAKRTFFGADVYTQTLNRFDTNQKFKDTFSGDFTRATLRQTVFTGGLYKWWDSKDPAVGFNIEYQFSCLMESGGTEKVSDYDISHRLAFDGGVKRLGPKHNIKVGMEVNHSLSDSSGYLKPGFKVSGIFPNCDWTSGVKWYYGKYGKDELNFVGRWEVGSYLSLALNY